MKFTVTKEDILECVVHIERIAGKPKDLQILGCVLLTVSDGELLLRGTNLDVGVEYRVVVRDGEDGVVAVPANIFSQMIANARPGANIHCSVDTENMMLVRAGESVARVALQNAEEFPVIPQVENPKEFDVLAQALVSVIKNVSQYTSASTIKPELASVFVQFDGNELVAVATDSFRLAEKRVSVDVATECEPFLVPGRVVSDLVYILEKEKGIVSVVRNEHQLAIVRKGVYATFRLTHGNFPAYEQVIPKEYSTSATLLVGDIESSLKKQVIFLDKFYKTTITVRAKEGVCCIDTKNEKVGELHEEVPATVEGDQDVSVNFNQKYLIDGLGPIPTDSCVFRFGKNGGPLLITPVGDTSFRYVVMPMNR